MEHSELGLSTAIWHLWNFSANYYAQSKKGEKCAVAFGLTHLRKITGSKAVEQIRLLNFASNESCANGSKPVKSHADTFQLSGQDIVLLPRLTALRPDLVFFVFHFVIGQPLTGSGPCGRSVEHCATSSKRHAWSFVQPQTEVGQPAATLHQSLPLVIFRLILTEPVCRVVLIKMNKHYHLHCHHHRTTCTTTTTTNNNNNNNNNNNSNNNNNNNNNNWTTTTTTTAVDSSWFAIFMQSRFFIPVCHNTPLCNEQYVLFTVKLPVWWRLSVHILLLRFTVDNTVIQASVMGDIMTITNRRAYTGSNLVIACCTMGTPAQPLSPRYTNNGPPQFVTANPRATVRHGSVVSFNNWANVKKINKLQFFLVVNAKFC